MIPRLLDLAGGAVIRAAPNPERPPDVSQLFLLKQTALNCGSHLQIEKDESESYRRRGILRSPSEIQLAVCAQAP
jgi:hypothetical protein